MFTLLRLIFLPAKVGVGTTKLGVKAGYRTGRLLGYRRLFVFGAGIAVGLLVAPTAGRELRTKIQGLIDERRGAGGGDLAEKVRYELSHSPRTWHLPQPEVEVVGSRAILRGEVPHEVGRADLERTAAAVAGVVDVDNLVDITGTNGHQ
ncbi:MAG: YtxH domain-containing protein [Acidimicrobiales bacterium]